jgi:hypothetical protein
MGTIDPTYRTDGTTENGGEMAAPTTTSVIELWRQREKSLASGGLPTSPASGKKSFSGSPGYSYQEEKKPKIGTASFQVGTKRPTVETQLSPVSSRRDIVVSPATPSWKPTRGPKMFVPETHNQESKSWVRPITPDTPDDSSRPAFGELKSKWATFGAQKLQARDEVATFSPKPEISSSTLKTREAASSDRAESAFDELIPTFQEEPFAVAEQKLDLSEPPQQPVLESSGRIIHRRRTKAGWSKPIPSPKVATTMYVKDRTQPGIIATVAATAESPSRLGKLSQKKQILERVRRRGTASATRLDVAATIQVNNDNTDNPARAQRPDFPSKEPGPSTMINEEPFDCTTSFWASADPPMFGGAATEIEAPEENHKASPKPKGEHSQPLSPTCLDDDEMMILDKEQQRSRPIGSNGRFRSASPGVSSGTTSESTTSHMVSTITGYTDANKRQREGEVRPHAVVADGFVLESASNVEAFQTTLKSLSLKQLANDISEEAGTVLKDIDLKKISTDLNLGIAAASRSLSDSYNKLVGSNEPRKKSSFSQRTRESSPVEEVAIEVEYVEDHE